MLFHEALILSSSRKIKSFIISLFRGYKFVGDGYPQKSIKSFFVLENFEITYQTYLTRFSYAL